MINNVRFGVNYPAGLPNEFAKAAKQVEEHISKIQLKENRITVEFTNQNHKAPATFVQSIFVGIAENAKSAEAFFKNAVTQITNAIKVSN